MRNHNFFKTLLISLAVGVLFTACSLFNAQKAPGVEEMAGEFLILGFNANSSTSKEAKRVAQKLEKGEISGVIFFKRNVASKEDLTALTASFKKAKADAIISIDEEGGLVSRFSSKSGFETFDSPQSVAKSLTPPQAKEYYAKMAKQLKTLGFNLNFAPVADLSNPASPIIAGKKRSFSEDEKVVTAYAKAFIAAHKEFGVATTLKHFAGHGLASSDTHKSATYSAFNQREIYPFKQLAKEAEAMMVSHIHFKGLDEANPAVFSKKVVDYARKNLGFKGVMVSDDLMMGALSAWSFEDRVVKSLQAGIDLLIISEPNQNKQDLALKARGAILQAVKEGRLSQKQLEKAYWRVAEFKKNLK